VSAAAEVRSTERHRTDQRGDLVTTAEQTGRSEG